MMYGYWNNDDDELTIRLTIAEATRFSRLESGLANVGLIHWRPDERVGDGEYALMTLTTNDAWDALFRNLGVDDVDERVVSTPFTASDSDGLVVKNHRYSSPKHDEQSRLAYWW
jgi:hypothetical protein